MQEKIIIFAFFLAGEDKNTEGIVNLYPNYNYSGKLRPWPQTPKRPVPDAIERPDYASHPEGRSLCEEKMRGETSLNALLYNCITKLAHQFKVTRRFI